MTTWIIFHIPVAAWFTILVLAFLHFRDYRRLCRYIEENNVDLWQRLGEPDLYNTSPRNVFRMLRFLQHSSDYEDTFIRNLAKKIKRRMLIFLVIFGGIAFFFLFLLIIR